MPFHVINFSLLPAPKGTFYLAKTTIERMLRTGARPSVKELVSYPFPSWSEASLVFFDRPNQVLNCGRLL